jgi:hypothetical protein
MWRQWPWMAASSLSSYISAARPLAARCSFSSRNTSAISCLSSAAGAQQTGMTPPGSPPVPPGRVNVQPAGGEGAGPGPGGDTVSGA